MKNKQLTNFLICLIGFMSFNLSAQDSSIQYFRDNNKSGINVFEPSKTADQPEFKGLHFKFGASFTQDFQSLKHSNTPTFAIDPRDPNFNTNLLYGTTTSDSTTATLTGFNTAMANLNLDVQLGDGIRMCVESYMSTRHHNEFWVKGGYIQVDKLPMFGNPEWFKKYLRLKVGHFQPNYGDMQFRRSDGGNTMYNPFVENNILDAFTTEIGGEAYVFPIKGLMLMVGMTGGTLEGNIDVSDARPEPFTFDKTKRKPSFLAKVAYDNTINKLRYRISASIYQNGGSPNHTLYYGDRAGSHYFMVMEQNRSEIRVDGISQGIGQSTYRNNKDSGRFIPVFNSEVNSFMVNAFVKYMGLEFFGTFESAEGRVELPSYLRKDEPRKVSQFSTELVYRFCKKEQCYLGVRYNSMTGTPFVASSAFAPPPAATEDGTITRLAISAGWFPLHNLQIKGEYVMQKYNDFTDYRKDGEFSGFVLEAAVSF